MTLTADMVLREFLSLLDLDLTHDPAQGMKVGPGFKQVTVDIRVTKDELSKPLNNAKTWIKPMAEAMAQYLKERKAVTSYDLPLLMPRSHGANSLESSRHCYRGVSARVIAQEFPAESFDDETFPGKWVTTVVPPSVLFRFDVLYSSTLTGAGGAC